MISTNEMNKPTKLSRLGITLPEETVEKMDELRGDVPRSKFVHRSLEQYMSKKVK